MNVSIFDLDRTLTKVGTYTPFLIFAAFHRAPWRLILFPLWILAMATYVLGGSDRKKLKEFGFLLLIGRQIPEDSLRLLAERFVDQILPKILRPGGQQHLLDEKAKGHFLILATASSDFYAQVIASRLGFDAVVATRQTRLASGAYSYHIAGRNCYGDDKLMMVQEALNTVPFARDAGVFSFYSDSAADAPMLNWVQNAYAVNPSRQLRKLAKTRGWPVLDFA